MAGFGRRWVGWRCLEDEVPEIGAWAGFCSNDTVSERPVSRIPSQAQCITHRGPERRQRLEEISFVWNTLSAAWEEGYAALKRFKEREGHCKVAHDYQGRS
jgi:streptomycin 6-kinase